MLRQGRGVVGWRRRRAASGAGCRSRGRDVAHASRSCIRHRCIASGGGVDGPATPALALHASRWPRLLALLAVGPRRRHGPSPSVMTMERCSQRVAANWMICDAVAQGSRPASHQSRRPSARSRRLEETRHASSLVIAREERPPKQYWKDNACIVLYNG